jgi:predicted nucleic acid-binding protein
MYLLDTNVISGLRRRDRADRRLLAWIDSVSPLDLWISVVTVMELDLGAGLIARRDEAQGDMLRRWIDNQVLPSFGDRILPIDLPSARRCAALHIPDARPERDAMIAATALVHRLTVVTRNVADFVPMGVQLIDPWNVG